MCHRMGASPRNQRNGGKTMKINYNMTGAARKSLVAAISEELNAPTNYLGAPTFAYTVAS